MRQGILLLEAHQPIRQLGCLNLDDKNATYLGGWLTHRHISAANQLMKQIQHDVCISEKVNHMSVRIRSTCIWHL